MWELRNRSVIILVSVLSGCVFLYSVWGSIFILSISLFLTIYACYFLIINDSLLSPHAFLLLDYCKHISFEVRTSFGTVIDHVYRYIRQFFEAAIRCFRKRYLTQRRPCSRMERRRGSNYQLSSDPYPSRKSSSHFGSITQLSPIPKNLQKASVSNDISSKIYFYPNSEHSSYNHDSFVAKRTSTPMLSRNKEELENQTFKLSPPGQVLSKRPSPLYGQNHVLMQVENSTYFDAEGSSWNSSITSKVDTKVGERKGIQTATGPLLASTRYNIDPKVYNDVTSPGLTARLTKYATEASNKLAHQSKYRVGQFPKVNLHASSVPLINVKSMKTRTPATVRVAPSHTIRYSPPSKQSILSNVHHSDNSCSSPSVAQALREISLKRHASREDVAFDPVKKQRRDIVASKEFEVQDETKQKRSREESLKSEEDSSPQSNKIVRPTKRTKTPSCYDIINSLSSSKHVVSGVKRKARDFSRSGTPDFEKHFKSLECVQSASTETIAQVPSTSPKYPDYELAERRNNSHACNSVDKLQEHSPLKGILKAKGNFNNRSVENESDSKHTERSNAQNSDKDSSVESIESIESAKLTHKLFMRAEPERNEKLRMLVEEQGNIRAKFTTDDVEEIKKEDITDMRQTSMKARLQSMFDAISGKAASRINPDVVIQAEEVNTVKSVACTVTCATLNSSTTTTNVNTTPISTSAVAPSLGKSESNTKSPKCVAFNLPAKNTSSNTNVQFADTSERKIENVLTSVADKTSNSTLGTTFSTRKSEIVSQPVVSNSTTTSSISLNVQNFDSNKSNTFTSTTTSTSPIRTTFMFDTVSANNKSPLLAVPVTTSIFGTVTTAAPIPSIISMSTTAVNAKNEPSGSNPKTNVSQVAAICSTSVNVSIGNMKGGMIFTSPHTNLVNLSSVAGKTEQNTGFTSIDTKANVMPFTSVANITGSNDALNRKSNVNVSTPLFTFGSKTNNNPPTTSIKTEGFVFGSAGNTSGNSETFGASTSTSRQASMIPNAATSSNNGNSGTQANSVTNASSANTGFEANAKVSLPTFGSSTNSTFASHPSSSSSVNDNKTGFSFGKASMTTNTATGTSNVGLFAVAKSNLPSSFGASSSTSTTINSSMAQIAPNTGSIFTNSSSAPSIFGTTTVSNQSIFGTSSNLSVSTATFTLPKSTTTSVFGSNVAATSAGFASTNSMPIFSSIAGGSSMGAISTTSIPMFGSSASTSTSGINTSEKNNVNSNLFSSTNLTTSISMFSTTSNIFGQANSATGTSFKSSSGVFGSNSGSTLFGSTQTTTSSTFGATNVSSNSTASTFGSTNIPASNASVPVFGTTTTGTFASQNQNKENPGTQTSTSQNFGMTSIFRRDNTGGAPVFGAANSATGHFNSPVTSNTFAGQNVPISSNPTFGMGTVPTSNGPPAFSDSNKVSPFAAQSSTFGAANVSSTPTFGNANANESNTSGIFTFGANQKPPQQNATTAFTFGSNNNTSASTPFQFGTTTSNSGTGFNFAAPTTTPSINFGTTNSTTTFNASAPGMFSIGSGSTASRSRNTRTRKLR